MKGLTKREAKAYFTFVDDCEYVQDSSEPALQKFATSCDLASIVDARDRILEIENFLITSRRLREIENRT